MTHTPKVASYDGTVRERWNCAKIVSIPQKCETTEGSEFSPFLRIFCVVSVMVCTNYSKNLVIEFLQNFAIDISYSMK